MKSITKICWILLLGVITNFWMGSVWAQYDPEIADENVDKSKVLVSRVSRDLLADIQKSKDKLDDKDVLKSLIERHVIPATDLEGVARRIVGEYWSELTSDQKAQLKRAFGNLVVNTYATALASYKDETLGITNAGANKSNHNLVRVDSVLSGSELSLKVIYYIRRWDSGLGIYDINVNGNQFSSTYKSSLQSFVSKKDFKALIANLESQGN